MTFIAGAYTATWNGANIGRTEQGFVLKESPHKQDITTDDFGQTVVNGVQLGEDVMVTLDAVEYNLIKPAMYGPAVQGVPKTNVGLLRSSLAHALVLTPIAGTGATDTFTFHLADVEGDLETLLSSRLRKGRVTFRCLPDPGSSDKAYTVS